MSASLPAPPLLAPLIAPISPRRELGAYEALWLQAGASFRTLAERFAAEPDKPPSDFVGEADAESCSARALARLLGLGVRNFGIRIHRSGDYPGCLRDGKYPVELLYYQGAWELTQTPCVAVVGIRQASADGIHRAREPYRMARRQSAARSGMFEFRDAVGG